MEKITGYLLNLSHVDGGPKARFFMRFGFDRSVPDLLVEALLAHPDANDVVDTDMTIWGVTSTVRCNLKTPDGRNPCI